MFGAFVVYTGLIIAVLGVICCITPLGLLRIRSRSRGVFVLVIGLIVVAIGLMLPAREVRVAQSRTELDGFMPVYQFHEFHSRDIPAACERVYNAVKSTSAEDILFFRTLIWIRRLGGHGRADILNPPPNEPLIDVATRTSFVLLAEQPGRELVMGTLVIAPQRWRAIKRPRAIDFQSLRQPGFALAAMNFRLQDVGPDMCRISTETRVFASDEISTRRFARYWRVIYPGSALIRRMWLRALAKRATSAAISKLGTSITN